VATIQNMPDRDYHSRPELSSTGARKLLESPAKFRYWSRTPQSPKQSFDLGHAVHAKVLGVGASIVVYPSEHLTPSGNVSTKAATVQWETEQRANGITPISRWDAFRVDAMAESVLKNKEARPLLESISGREVTLLADVEGVSCRCRFDLYDGVRGADLKTAKDASPAGFNRSVGAYGYHIQERWYEDVHKAETGQELQSFPFIVVESAAPYLVGVYDLDFMWEDIAKKRTEKARDLYRSCMASGEWPGYATATLTPPTWAVYENEEEEIQV